MMVAVNAGNSCGVTVTAAGTNGAPSSEPVLKFAVKILGPASRLSWSNVYVAVHTIDWPRASTGSVAVSKPAHVMGLLSWSRVAAVGLMYVTLSLPMLACRHGHQDVSRQSAPCQRWGSLYHQHSSVVHNQCRHAKNATPGSSCERCKHASGSCACRVAETA
jgi:hypothetical protein